jgi:hypothetical protein
MSEALVAEQRHELPADIVAFVDGLDADGVDRLPPSRTTWLRLCHGSSELEDGLLEFLDTQLTAATQTFIHSLEDLAAISPDTGLPTPALNTGLALHYRWGSYESPFGTNSGELSGWLETARDHLPGAQDEALAAVIDAAAEFDPEQFDLALGLAGEEIKLWSGGKFARLSGESLKTYADRVAGLVRGDAIHMAEAVIGKVQWYATDVDLLRRTAALPLVRTYGKAEDLLRLQQQILERQSQLGPVQDTAEYNELVAQASTAFMADRLGIKGIGELAWAFRQDPGLIAVLAAQNPKEEAKLRKLGSETLLRLDAADRTPAHAAVILELEQKAVADLDEYADFLLELFKQGGSLSEQQVITLTGLVMASPDTRPNDWTCKVICALAPMDQVSHVLNERPRLLQCDTEIGAIAARRLAREGWLDEAKEIARRPLTNDSANALFNPIHNLLAVYEESGDESAWDEAEQRMATVRLTSHYTQPTSWFEAAARQFVAARKQGKLERAEVAATAMQAFYTHEFAHVREYSLGKSARIFLDSGELDKAEMMAALLYEHYQSDMLGKRDKSYRFDALLAVMEAYIQAGQSEAAADITRRYFLTEPTPGYHLLAALDTLSRLKNRWKPVLYASSLDSLAGFLNRHKE